MTPEKPTVHLPNLPSYQMLNREFQVIARYRYSNDRNQAIIQKLQDNHLFYSEIDRAHYLDDMIQISAQGGYDSFDNLKKLITYLPQEDSYYVWSRFLVGFNKLKTSMTDDQKTYLSSLVLPYTRNYGLEKLGFNSTAGTHLDRKIRSSFVKFHSSLNEPTTSKFVDKLFENWVFHDNEVPSDLKNIVYTKGMNNFSKTAQQADLYKIYVKILDKWHASHLLDEKLRLYKCLCNVEDENLLRQLINWAVFQQPIIIPDPITGKNLVKNLPEIKDQDALTSLYAVNYYTSDSLGKKIVQDWLDQNFLALVDKFGLQYRRTARYIGYIFGSYKTEADVEFAEKFAKNMVDGLKLSGKIAVYAGIDKAKANLFLIRNLDDSGFFT